MSETKRSNRSGTVLLRAAIMAVLFALLYPILLNVHSAWASFAAKFPGRGSWPYLFSAAVFLAALVLLSWLLGTAPVKLLKTGITDMWRYLVMKKFSDLEAKAENGKSWRGKEVVFAEEGRFGAAEVAPVWSLGIVTADYGKWVAVFLIVPPGGTSRLIYVEKKGGRLWLTGRSVQKHGEAFFTFGNGVNPDEFLPKNGPE